MTPKEASKIIGCNVTTVTRYARLKKIKAKKVRLKKTDQGYGRHKHRWEINAASVKKFAKTNEERRGGIGKARS